MKVYGTPDADTAAAQELLRLVAGLDVAYILHHPRIDMHARACQWPGSLRVQAVLSDGTVLSVRQLKPGGPVKVEK